MSYEKCEFFDGKYCKNGKNDFDGLCSPEGCFLSRKLQIKYFGLSCIENFEKYALDGNKISKNEVIKYEN